MTAVIDAFGGPGGWAEALRALGHDDIGIEWDAQACATRAAAGHLAVRADVATFPLDHLPKGGGFIASPPCPSFSSAGDGAGRDELPKLHGFTEYVSKHGWQRPWSWAPWSDPRTPLVLEPLRWVEALRPEWIALEQVPPVLPLWEQYARVWGEKGYSVWVGVLNAADFGVPQIRHRALLVASLTKVAVPPDPTHSADAHPSLFGALLPHVSMAEALGWDPEDQVRKVMGAGMVERHGDRPGRKATEPAFAVRSAAGGAEPGGFVRLHTNRDQRLDGSRQTRECSAPALTAKAGGQWAWERPATTVQGDPRIGHPGHKDRSGGESQFERDAIKLTLQEGLILQSFRPDYPVQGTKTKAWEQIGNAIPPLLARPVLEVLV